MLSLARACRAAAPRASAVRAMSTEVALPKPTVVKVASTDLEELPTTTLPGQSFQGDLRSVSGVGLGDGIEDHTDKWLNGDKSRSPLHYIQTSEPIKVHGAVVASYGADDHGLGAPVQYISLKGTSREHPAVCKYTGNKYYSEDWRHAH